MSLLFGSLSSLKVAGLQYDESSPLTSSSVVLWTIMGIAGVTALSLPLWQSDYMSRKLLLQPRPLQSKRQQSYGYKWSKALLVARENVQEKLLDATLLLKLDKIQRLAEDCCHQPATVSLLSIQKDNDDDDPTQEYYVYIQVSSTIYQVPLVVFGQALASHMENTIIATTAFCFVADASSHKGSDLVASLCAAIQPYAGVAVIREPLWMAILAALLELQLYEESKLQRVLFGLARLEALKAVEQEKKKDSTATKKIRTILITLPGQATTPSLLRHLQETFSHERHLFIYDGCVNSVLSGMNIKKRKNDKHTSSSSSLSRRFENSVQVTTPLHNVTTSSLCRQIPALYEPLSQLPITIASLVETWMGSVSAVLELKQQNERNNNTYYLPYVCKLTYLLIDETATQTLALTNLLQFITGSRSRPLSNELIDAAVETWRDLVEQKTNNTTTTTTLLSQRHIKAIEACVFLHHGILIENKTLLDTVVPAKEWTLKAAKKISGCACCAPDEEDEEDEESRDNNEDGMEMPGVFATATMGSRGGTTTKKQRPKYVDGKMGFAFDPTAFS